MSKVHDSVIDSLAVYRLTKLVVDDEITSDLRGRWFERFDPQETKLGFLVSCPWCVSIWAGAAVVAARRAAPRAWTPVAEVLALSAVTGILNSRV